MQSMSKPLKRKRQPAARKQGSKNADREQTPVGRFETVDIQSFLAERERRGTRVSDDVEAMRQQAGIIFRVGVDEPISETCLECLEFMSSAARDAAAAVDVLDNPELDDDPHLKTALKKYVEDTGEALTQIDKRLKDRGSSLTDLFPDLPDRAEDTAAWRDLIGRRLVIAHKILTVDYARVRREANRDFGKLYCLLRNINFVPAMTDFRNGRPFDVTIRGELLTRLPPVTPGSDDVMLGSSLILVCDDVQEGLQTFRLARVSDSEFLATSSLFDDFKLSIRKLEEPDA